MSPPADTSAPARIFGILARAAPVAVLFRRGPSRHVQMLRWDLETDKVTPGQWLKHRVYERRGDLSPDGRHLIYFAAPHKPPLDSYTAISRPPYFTALALLPHGGAWNGGGVFLDNKRYWVDQSGPCIPQADQHHPGCTLSRVMQPPAHLVPSMGEDAVLYLPRLQRDGWTLEAQDTTGSGWLRTETWHLSRPVIAGWTLHKRFTASLTEKGPQGQIYWETHRLEGPDGGQDLHDGWAEAHRGEVLFAKDGDLFRQAPRGTPRLIAHLTPNRFEPVSAPYEGIIRPTSPATSPPTSSGPIKDMSPWHPLKDDKT
ncbi:hypothetical protein SAMN04488527_10170 [Aliiroseovarius crassostreae]|uniref:hypothetical protein n=1 Tax=Aliiroseovarius crassostreae TaxID=154981 RepID=UPI0008E25893|nr:hypothetical protein [Aliiroseovarius crassostreae]SFU28222.1 hypothetical protein SAMN04488527_10170 [Aliiroseovarius crassostreae]